MTSLEDAHSPVLMSLMRLQEREREGDDIEYEEDVSSTSVDG